MGATEGSMHRDTALEHAETIAPPSGTIRSTVLPRTATTSVPGGSDLPRYAPVRVLGRGGLGEVTLERDNDIERSVAVKRLRRDAASQGNFERFVDEIRTVGQLEHPNIPQIHDVGIDDEGRHYFVMRYVVGDTLEVVIAKLRAGDPDYHRRYTFAYRTQILLGIINALGYAHAQRVIHRDLKPANIMVGPHGEVVVMDWGIAKKLGPNVPPGGTTAPSDRPSDDGSGTQHGSLVGTPAYMAPEQAQGEIDRIDERSDIYSLSVVFHELLGLRHYLADNHSQAETIAAVVDEQPVHPSLVANPHQPTVPVELGWFVMKGLAKNPADRYQSVTEMMDELQRNVDGKFHVDCYKTLIKRGGTSALRYVDAHPRSALAALVIAGACVVFSVVQLAIILLR